MTTEVEQNLAKAIEQCWQSYQTEVFDPENPRVDLHHPTFGPEEIFAFTQQMLTTYVTLGEKVKSFERDFCKLLGYQHGVSNNSGSSANLLMFAALANKQTENYLRPGDEVILPALTWSTSLWPIVQQGLVPVFVDSEASTLNMCPKAVEEAIGPKTKAILAVPIYGNPCDMEALTDICERHQLILIEDCCESMGAKYAGKSVGCFGKVASYSFYYSHHITTLEGGMCVTADSQLAELMRILRAHGWVRQTEDPEKWTVQYPDIDPKFLFVNEGYNLRITEPQAAMGLIQLNKLGDFVKARRLNAEYFNEQLSTHRQWLIPQTVTENAEHSWFGYPITVTENAPFSCSEIRQYLDNKGIETRPVLAGNLVRHPAIQQYQYRVSGDLACADLVMTNSFAVGCHQSLTQPAREYLVTCIKNFINGTR